MKWKAAMAAAVSVSAALTMSAAAQDANVRVIHASPDAPPVDVFVNGGLAFSNLGFTGITDYVGVPGGTYDVEVTPFGDPGTVVIDAMLSLTGGQDYSVLAIDTLSNIQPLVLLDDNTLDANNARVRFVHASPDAPAVDIAVAGGGPVLFGNISFSEVGDYLAVPGGMYDLEVRVANTSNVVLELAGLELMNNTVYSVFAMGFAGGDEPGLQAVLSIDAVPAPGALALLALGGLTLRSRRRSLA